MNTRCSTLLPLLGDNRNMVSLGANVKVGYQDPTLKMSRFEMAKQIKDLQSDNASLRTEVDEIKAALKTLQEAAVNTGRRDL